MFGERFCTPYNQRYASRKGEQPEDDYPHPDLPGLDHMLRCEGAGLGGVAVFDLQGGVVMAGMVVPVSAHGVPEALSPMRLLLLRRC